MVDQAVSRGTMPGGGELGVLRGLLGRLVDGCVEDERRLGHDRGTARDHQAGLVGGGRVDRLDQDRDRGLGALVADDLRRPARGGTCRRP